MLKQPWHFSSDALDAAYWPGALLRGQVDCQTRCSGRRRKFLTFLTSPTSCYLKHPALPRTCYIHIGIAILAKANKCGQSQKSFGELKTGETDKILQLDEIINWTSLNQADFSDNFQQPLLSLSLLLLLSSLLCLCCRCPH